MPSTPLVCNTCKETWPTEDLLKYHSYFYQCSPSNRSPTAPTVITRSRSAHNAATPSTSFFNIEIHSIFRNGQPFVLESGESLQENFQALMEVIKKASPRLDALYRKELQKASFAERADVKEKIRIYNRVVGKMAGKLSARDEWARERCSPKVAKAIMELACRFADPDYDVLRLTKKGSADLTATYGEITFDQLASLIQEVGVGPSDVFVDLGSGIGQAVCYLAAATEARKCVGIEVDVKRASTATALLKHFEGLMKFCGKRHGQVELRTGSFFDGPQRRFICDEANVIFTSNMCFSTQLNAELEELFKGAADGARVISNSEFALGSKNHQITARNEDQLISMVDKKVLTSIPGGFSWSDKPVKLFLITINRAKKALYEAEKQRRALAAANQQTSSRR